MSPALALKVPGKGQSQLKVNPAKKVGPAATGDLCSCLLSLLIIQIACLVYEQEYQPLRGTTLWKQNQDPL